MDLKQRKLNKSEWESIEIPVTNSELCILNMIIKGYYDVNIRMNNSVTIFTHLKVEYNEKMEDYIYNRYLRKQVDIIEDKINSIVPSYKKMNIDVNIKPNSCDRIRLERFDENNVIKSDIYEFVLMNHLDEMLTSVISKKMTTEQSVYYNKIIHFHYYVL